MVWQKITLNKDQLQARAGNSIESRFRKLHDEAGRPRKAGLLVGRFPDQTGAIEIYFSPEAARIAQPLIDDYAGIPCNPPPRQRVQVLCGSEDALEELDAMK